jgi:hypothetical protein
MHPGVNFSRSEDGLPFDDSQFVAESFSGFSQLPGCMNDAHDTEDEDKEEEASLPNRVYDSSACHIRLIHLAITIDSGLQPLLTMFLSTRQLFAGPSFEGPSKGKLERQILERV